MIREERNALLLLVLFTAAAGLLYVAVLRPALVEATRPELDAAAASPSSAPATPERREGSPTSREEGPDARPKSARRMLGLEARLVDAVTGRPLTDAEVRIQGVEDIAEPTALLDGAGRLRVDHLPPDITFGLEIDCEGYAPRAFRLLRGEARDVVPLGVVALEPRRSVEVSARNAHGAPLAGATVTVHARDGTALPRSARERAARVAEALLSAPLASALTDADGEGRCEALPAVDALVVVTGGEGPAVALEVDALAADVDEDVSIGLGVPFRGRLVDPAGKGVAGTTIVLIEARATPPTGLSVTRVESDAEGRFAAAALSPAPHYVVAVAPHVAAQALGPFPVDTGEEVLVTLPDGGTLEGVVRCRSGRLPADVRLTARSDAPGSVRLETVATRDGRFSVESLAVGHVTLEARAPGFAPERAFAPVSSFGGDVEVHLDPPAALGGRVTSSGADPLPGAVVHDLSTGSRAVTDEEGRFRLEDLAAGRTVLEARAARHAPARTEAEVRLRDEATAAIDLAPGGELRVVVRGGDGSPVKGANVFAYLAPLGTEGERVLPLPVARSRTDSAGVARLSHLANDAAFVLWVVAPSLAPARSNRLELGAELRASGVAMTLGGGGAVEGTVHDASAARVAGAIVTALPEAGPGGGAALVQPDATDEEGAFRLDRLAPGRYRIVARRGVERAVSAPIDVREGRRAREVDLTLTPVVPLLGRVVDERGFPVTGATVVLREVAAAGEGRVDGDADAPEDAVRAAEAAEALEPLEAVTDAAGRFLFVPWRRVEHEVQVTAGGRQGSARARAGEGRIDVRLESP